jgi:WD40 repeat protein
MQKNLSIRGAAPAHTNGAGWVFPSVNVLWYRDLGRTCPWEAAVSETPARIYNAFVSYSHAADGKLAPALRAGLHRFAKPWYRLRALHVFHDKANLSVNPELWSSIIAALDESEWFILLASPEAATSIWVDREIEYWLGRRSVDRILMVLTDGALTWTENPAGFDPRRSGALPARLMHAFARVPLYLDLTWARQETDLSLRHPRFREAVAELAATVTGRSKEELIGEEVRQYRHTRRLARSAVTALSVLTLSAVAAALFAVRQRSIADAQRAQAILEGRIALAGRLAAESRSVVSRADQLPLAVLLAIESTRIQPGPQGNQALRAAASLLPRPVFSLPNDRMDSRVRALAFSSDGKVLAAARDDGTLDLLQTATGTTVATLSHEEHPGEVTVASEGGIRWHAPGFGAEMTSVAFSADGKVVASASNDGSARLWETATGRELHRLVHGGGVSTVAFNPAGNYLATGSKDATARLWDVRSGREVFRVELGEEVRKVVFSPNGRQLAAISVGTGICLVDVNSRRVSKKWIFGDGGLGLAFSAGSEKLATASGETVAVWDVETAKLLFKAKHRGPSQPPGLNWVNDVAFSPDATLLASAGRDQTARIWHLESGQELMRLVHDASVTAVAFSPDGSLLSTASVDGSSRVWEMSSGRERLRARNPGGSEVVAFSPDGQYVASGGLNGEVDLWSLNRTDELARMEHGDAVNVVAVSPDGKLIATSAAGAVALWSSLGKPLVPAVKLPLPSVERLVFSEDGTHLAASWGSSSLFLLNAANNLSFVKLGDSHIGDLTIGPRYIAVFDRKREALRLWETASGHELDPIPAAEYLDKLMFDPSGNWLASKERDVHGGGPIKVWKLPEGREVGRLAVADADTFTLGPQGKLVAVATWEPGAQQYSPVHHVDVFDVAANRRIARLPGDENVKLLFGAHDELVIGVGSEVRIFDFPTGRMMPLLRNDSDVEGVRWSQERDILATLSRGNVRLWNVTSSELLTQITSDDGFLDVRFADRGRHLVTGGRDHRAVVWLWEANDLREEACKRVGRSLTDAEWALYLGSTPYDKTCTDAPYAPVRSGE